MDLLPATIPKAPALVAAPFQVVSQPSLFREPTKRTYETVPYGATLLELVLQTGMGELCDGVVRLPGKVAVSINGHLIDRDFWHLCRPKPGSLVNITLVPESQRQAIMIGATLAIATLAIAAAVLIPGVGGLVAAALISTGGTYALTAFLPPEAANEGVSGPHAVNAVTSQSNRLEPSAFVPIVLGNMRLFPMHYARPYTEAAGSDVYLRMLLVVGQGPLEIPVDQINVGATAIEELADDFDWQIREGRTSDPPLTLFTKDIFEINPTSTLGELFAFAPQVQTTQTGTTEITLDLTWPRGIFHQGKVNRDPYTVTFTIGIRPTGIGSYVDFLTGSSTLTQHTEQHETSELIRRSYRRTGLTAGTYDVRVDRTNGNGGEQNPSAMFWTALRSIQPNDPRPDKTLACIAIRAKRTPTGSVEAISCWARSYALDWNGVAWVEAITNNPASLGRHLLQGDGINPNPISNSRLDLQSWQEFHEHCENEVFTFNGVFDDESTVRERLAVVLAAGRGRLIPPDTKYAIAIDKNGKSISGMITPRNSSDFKGVHILRPEVQALRVPFINATKAYAPDERMVYNDGFNSTNVDPGKVEIYDLTRAGITFPGLAWRHARYRLAEMALRLDIYTVTQGIESLQHVPGDLVAFQHHVPLLGLTRGRIKSLVLSAGDELFADEFSSLSLDTALNGSANWAWKWVAWNENLLTSNGDQAFKAWSGYTPGGGGQTPAAMGVVLHQVSGGTLKLYGRVNPNTTGYGVPYLGGMISSELSESHLYGTWEIRVKFTLTKGQKWAIWMAVTGDAGLGLQEVDIAELVDAGTPYDQKKIFFNTWGNSVRFGESWTGSNGAVWPTARWETALVTGTSTVTIQSSDGQMLVQGGSYQGAKIYSKSPLFDDFDLTVQVILGSADEQYAFINFRADGAFGSTHVLQPLNGYSVMVIPSGINLYSLAGGVRTELGTGGPGVLGTSPWNLRVQCRGSTIRVKIWQGAETHGIWSITATNNVHTTGIVGLAASNGAAGTAQVINWDSLEVVRLPPVQVMHNGTTPANEVDNLGPYIEYDTEAERQSVHTLKFDWNPTSMEWWVDGIKRMSCANYITDPMHLMISPEIGGLWEGPPDGTTVWPTVAEIDYIRLTTPEVSGVTLDDLVTMEAGHTYAARIRMIDGAGVDQFVLRNVITVPGETNTLTFSTPFEAGSLPQVGDLLTFGETGLATVNCIVKEVTPGPNKTAQITLIDEAPAVNLADQGEIPEYESFITIPGDFFGIPPAVPIIESIVVQNISHPSQPDFITAQRIVVHLRAVGSARQAPTGYEVELKRADQQIYQRRYSFPADASELTIDVVQSNALYDVRVRATGRSPRGIPNESKWSTVRQIYVPLPRLTPGSIAEVAGLELQGQGNDTTFEGSAAHFVWRITARSGAFQIHADQETLVNFVDPSFAWYEVDILDPSKTPAYLRRRETTTTPQFTYTIADNKEDSRRQSAKLGGSTRPLRRFTARVSFVDRFGRRSQGQTLTVSNPAPAVPSGVLVSGKVLAINVRTNVPTNEDFEKTNVYVGTASGFNPAAASTQVFSDLNNVVLIANQPGGVTKYVRVAHADRFSDSVADLRLTSEISVVIEAPDGPPQFRAQGIRFTRQASTDTVRWTSGFMYIMDGATTNREPVDAGEAQWTTGVLWLYYVRGFGAIQATTNGSLANQPDRVALAQYFGGVQLSLQNGLAPVANLATARRMGSFGTSQNTWQTLIECDPIITAGNPVQVTISLSVNASIGGVNKSLNAAVRIFEGSVIREWELDSNSTGAAGGNVGVHWTGTLFHIHDAPTRGTQNYIIQGRFGTGGDPVQEIITWSDVQVSAQEAMY